MPKSILLSGLVAAALALTACGSSGPSAEDEAGDAAVRALESKDPKAFCRQLVSDRLLDEVFAGQATTCVKSSAVEDHAGATASAVSLQGQDESRAEVAVRIEGGRLGGSSGHVELVREDDRWLLDRFGDDYLRSTFLTTIEKADEGALATPSVKSCIGDQAADLPAERIREIAQNAIVRGEAVAEDLLPLAENCREALVEYGAEEISDVLAEEGNRSPAYVRCFRRELEKSLLLTAIAPELIGEEPDFGALLALKGISAGPERSCGQE